MACLISRWFQRRRAPAKDAVPALPDTSTNERLLLPTARLNIQKHEHVLLLGCLRQGSYILAFDGIPAGHDTNELKEAITNLPGFVSLVFSPVEDKLDLLIIFATIEDATMALATHPSIDLGNGTLCIGRNVEFENDLEGPARKKQRVEEAAPPPPCCGICGDTETDELSVPCFYCKGIWCHDCLKRQFTVALKDQAHFPAQCCRRVLHFDVVKGILPSGDYTKYRERFEEHNTTKPVYCALPSCSAFLPPRIAKPNIESQINCPQCQNTTCIKCRVLVDSQVKHECVLAEETTALLTKFGYKSCPRCGAGVAKMFGCPHVRCQCGAHWCWECQRPIQICWGRPCAANRDDDDYYDEEESVLASEDAPEANTETVPQTENNAPEIVAPQIETTEGTLTTETASLLQEIDTQEISTTAASANETVTVEQLAVAVAATVAPSTPAVEEAFVNLDSEDADEWEAGDYDFGDEPIDESWDTWGCMHRINPVINKNIWGAHRDWCPNTLESGRSKKEIDCQRCYKTITLIDPESEVVEKHERKDSACDVTTSVESQPSAESAEASNVAEQKEDKKKRKARKKSERPELYNCAKCGIFYCLPCNKAVKKEIHYTKHSIHRPR